MIKHIFLSAELEGRTDNPKRTEQLRSFLKRFKHDYTECLGVYKGSGELSFRVSNKPSIMALSMLAFKSFGQESILLVDTDNKATLLYSDGSKEDIGIFTKVDSEKNLDNYTIIGDDIYTTKKGE